MDEWCSLKQDHLSVELVIIAYGIRFYSESAQPRKGKLDLSSYPWQPLPTRQREPRNARTSLYLV